MRICFLADAASIHSQKWISYFAARGEDVHWFSLTPFSGPTPGATCYDIRPGGLGITGPVLSSPGVRHRLKTLQPDLTHVHSVGSYGLLALLAAPNPLVATVWGSDVLLAHRSPLKRFAVGKVLKKADLVTCDAKHIVADIERLGAHPSRIQLVNFGVDVDRFSPDLADQRLREKLGLGPGPLVISLRNLEPVYDLGTVITAASQVRLGFPDAEFLVVGRGSDERRLLEQARSAGLDAAVHFLGAIPNEELPDYLRLADVYVSTALSDAGIAASTAEAMACGLPVVVTGFGDNASWVQQGKGGFLVPLRDPAALAERVTWLLRNREAAGQFGTFNRTVIVERNNYHVEMARMHDLYRGLATAS